MIAVTGATGQLGKLVIDELPLSAYRPGRSSPPSVIRKQLTT